MSRGWIPHCPGRFSELLLRLRCSFDSRTSCELPCSSSVTNSMKLLGIRASGRKKGKLSCAHIAPMPRQRFHLAVVCLLLLNLTLLAQTFEISPGGTAPTAPAKKKSKAAPNQSAPAENGIGWGSGIEVARQARAAQQALQKNDYAAAGNYATRAANAAPQNPALWFLLGYSARMAGRYQVSLDAYQLGLKLQPSSIQGLSGLAQTYAKAGRQAEAQDTLQKVLAANPKSVTDLQLAGELSLSSDAGTALQLLKRAEALQPSA